MPRFYVKNPQGKWNIYSTIVDDLLIDEWVDFEKLKNIVINDYVQQAREDLETLLTDKPRLNVMSYKEYLKEKNNG